MRHIVLFLTGCKGSGKTTVFNILKDLNPEIVEIQLAKKLKDTCAEIFKVDRDTFDNPDTKEVPFSEPIVLDIFSIERLVDEYKLTPNLKQLTKHQGVKVFTPRHLLQYVGTDILRALCPDIHCAFAARDIFKTPGNTMFVVTDGRFENEFDYFRKAFRFTFYPFYIKNDRAEEVASKDNHPSETNVRNIISKCAPIENNGSLSALLNNVMIAFEDVLMDTTFPHGAISSNYPYVGSDDEGDK